MITEKDLYDILENKITNEAQKAFIKNNLPPHIAGRMCAAIDGKEKAELFRLLLMEWNEWMIQQQIQQQVVQAFLNGYYK